MSSRTPSEAPRIGLCYIDPDTVSSRRDGSKLRPFRNQQEAWRFATAAGLQQAAFRNLQDDLIGTLVPVPGLITGTTIRLCAVERCRTQPRSGKVTCGRHEGQNSVLQERIEREKGVRILREVTAILEHLQPPKATQPRPQRPSTPADTQIEKQERFLDL